MVSLANSRYVRGRVGRGGGIFFVDSCLVTCDNGEGLCVSICGKSAGLTALDGFRGRGGGVLLELSGDAERCSFDAELLSPAGFGGGGGDGDGLCC